MPDTEGSLELLRNIITETVKNGMRASLTTASLLTGAQVVTIDFYDDVPAAELGEFEEYTTIPTVASGLGQLEHRISTLLDKLNSLPLDKTVSTVNLAVVELNRTLAALRNILEVDSLQTIPVEVEGTLAAVRSILEADSSRNLAGELDKTLVALRKILEKDSTLAIPDELKNALAAASFQLEGESPESYQLLTTLKEVEAAARALREFLDLLEVKPEALIRGKTNTGQ
jgi:paraquat-inducible protein B